MKTLPADRQAYLDAERAKWLTLHEAAYVLRVSLKIVVGMVKSGSLAHRREGTLTRIHLDHLKPSITQPEEVCLDQAAAQLIQNSPVPRVPVHLNQTSRRLRAFEGGRPRGTASKA